METKMVSDNKVAWEYRVLEWRKNYFGEPAELALKIMENPYSFLRYHREMFENVRGKRIASVCGSDAQRAVALALLAAIVTVFDISEMQKQYALELAKYADVKIEYKVGDFCAANTQKYGNSFDIVYCEGGILHYFHDLKQFFSVIYCLLNNGGRLILCDYHPFQKMLAKEYPERNVASTEGNYFDNSVHEGHLPYEKYFSVQERADFPKCQLRFYTLSDIFNAVINSGMTVESFTEHPKRDMPEWPGEYTLIASKK